MILAFPRLFYKYRGVEKIAEGRRRAASCSWPSAFPATTAFAHALAFCQRGRDDLPAPRRRRGRRCCASFAGRAGAPPPSRRRHRRHLRLDRRWRSRPTRPQILEEEPAPPERGLAGHRYLFGLLRPGGLAATSTPRPAGALAAARLAICARMDGLERMLRFSSSFLDRLEEVGVIAREQARRHGLVGPVARASGMARDLRQLFALRRLRAVRASRCRARARATATRACACSSRRRASPRLIASRRPPRCRPGRSRPRRPRPGAALGAVEAPRGAAYHWLRLDEAGARGPLHAVTPPFHQLARVPPERRDLRVPGLPDHPGHDGLSVAENDR